MSHNITYRPGNSGQTATELAIFGTVLVLVLGLLIKYALSFSYNQGLPMTAFRQALLITSGRLGASVSIIEDRDIPDVSNPLATSSRAMFSSVGSAINTNYLLGNLNYGDLSILPYLDMYINGRHFLFTEAAFKTYDMGPDVRDKYVYTKITVTDDDFQGGAPFCPASGASFPLKNCFDPRLDPASAYWQWKAIGLDTGAIVPREKKNISTDVDNDGKEEMILETVAYTVKEAYNDPTKCKEFKTQDECEWVCWDSNNDPNSPKYDPNCMDTCTKTCKTTFITQLKVMDYQEGDLDTFVDSDDIAAGKVTQGLTAEQKIRSEVEPGSVARRQEDITKIVNTFTTKRTDTITRIIQLNCHSPVVGDPNSPEHCPDNGTGKCCCSKKVLDALGPDDKCVANTGELYVISKPTVRKTTTWTTPH